MNQILYADNILAMFRQHINIIVLCGGAKCLSRNYYMYVCAPDASFSTVQQRITIPEWSECKN
jgi:hypothetical protein